MLPHITRVANPYEVQDPLSPEVTAMHGVGAIGGDRRSDVLPSEEWRETFLWRFKNFRKVRTFVQLHPGHPHGSFLPLVSHLSAED